MTLSAAAILAGALLMAYPGDAIKIEPGKQLPQSVTVRAENDKGEDSDVRVRYMLFVPRDYKADGEPWPLMLFLHGYGECSDTDLDRVKIHGPAKIVDSRPDFPFVLVTPQCPPFERDMKLISTAWKPEQLVQLLDHVSGKLNIDGARVYVTGLSMGGYGTWRLVAAHPERFAAAAPICGGGEPEKMAEPLTGVPIWAFHGALDEIVPLARSEEMVEAVRRAGGDVRLTVYPEVAHDSWVRTYGDEAVYDWLLSHRRERNEERGARSE
jgi:predicted peptidase